MGVGQVVRSLAMAHAAGNFNHHVQSRRKDGHVLVTDGIYSVLRHPSYFGFFWWGLGTQMVLGNFVCFALYALVLWRFFAKRIEREFYLVSTSHYVISFLGGFMANILQARNRFLSLSLAMIIFSIDGLHSSVSRGFLEHTRHNHNFVTILACT